MTRTVNVVIAGADLASMAATIEAAREGQRVLIVIRSTRASVRRRLRQALRSAGVQFDQAVVVTGAEVACVDGVDTIEAVVVRDLRTGRLTGFNVRAAVP